MAIPIAADSYLEKVATSSVLSSRTELAKRVIPSAAVSHLALVAVSSAAVFYLAKADIPAAAVF